METSGMGGSRILALLGSQDPTGSGLGGDSLQKPPSESLLGPPALKLSTALFLLACSSLLHPAPFSILSHAAHPQISSSTCPEVQFPHL